MEEILHHSEPRKYCSYGGTVLALRYDEYEYPVGNFVLVLLEVMVLVLVWVLLAL